MSTLDWMILGGYFVLSIGVGVYFARRAGRSTTDFFLSGRSLPWWLAGLSMVATTFGADTPLAVTELVASNGIAGNWLWWNMAIGGMVTVFFFAHLWRRAEVMTDLEFIEIRYDGKPAGFLRGFRALYLGLFMNAIIMGWVNVAMATILEGMFGISAAEVFWYIAAAMLFSALYSTLSGLWGVAVTDAVQFVIAMAGCIILAVLVVDSPEIGGLAALQNALPASTFNLLPVIGTVEDGVTGVLALSGGAFLAYVGMQWWASWYPGAEPGGGGYVAQRMLSTKNEKHSVFAVLFFQITFFCLRPWPWILVALAALVLYPQLDPADAKLGYIYAMNDFLPSGVKGVMVAAFFAAYMSTISTHLNWGSSYLVHDFWRRFAAPGRSEKHYVFASRVTTMLLMLASLLLTLFIDSIAGAWQFIIECGAGLGLVLLLRWYWWRINAWSEITATIAPGITYAAITVHNLWKPAAAIVFPDSMFIIVGVTTVSWLLVTVLTPATGTATLSAFYRRVRPSGFWGPLSAVHGDISPDRQYATRFLGWILGVLLIYSVLFLVAALLFGNATEQFLWAASAGSALLCLWYILARLMRESKHDTPV
ncbi:MAG: sodium:solute symporter family protein [Bacteroidota bacterium]|nr:sodium:solute symporter family protein [Bacteroidota bacterium]